ncbi:MAG: SRPBCC domain-containing protein [Phycisphaerales bacterium JB038]
MFKRRALLYGLAVLLSSLSVDEVCAEAGGRTLSWETTVNAPIDQVWDLFTTEAGVESWMVPDATLDFRVGGSYITAYQGEATLDNPACIVHRILSYEPQRMISLRVERAPEGFPHGEVVRQAWGVTTFEAVGPDRTHIRLASVGWGEGEAWEAAEQFFAQGNRWTLERLQEIVGEDEAATAASPLSTMTWLVGGEWVHESEQPGGGVFRVRNVVEHGPDGQSLIARGWLGSEQGMFHHGDTQVWREPVTGEVRFQNINESGVIARGTIALDEAGGLIWDWNAAEGDGAQTRYHVRMKPEGEDVYRFVLSLRLDSGALEELVNITYDRVAKAPERFRRLREE